MMANVKTVVQNLSSIPTWQNECTAIASHLNSQISEVQTTHNKNVASLVKLIDDLIAVKELEYQSDEYVTIRKSMSIPVRRYKLPADSSDEWLTILVGRIQLHSDWHYPGLEIMPFEHWLTDKMVGLDPLYIAAFSENELQESTKHFAQEYQQRLCKYVINHHTWLEDLPVNQFGFILSWNMVCHLLPDEISALLVSLERVLRPGGVALFGFNDGAEINGAKNVEYGGMTYITKQELFNKISNAGLTVHAHYCFNPKWYNISWVEVSKPGIRQTIKAHQTLGLIEDIK